MNRRIVLFDADGVLTVPGEFFSVVYSKEYGLDEAKFGEFFSGVFQDAVEGKADLKKLIEENQEIWNWHGSVEDLLNRWFESENLINQKLIQVVMQLEANEIPCYLATNQEKYRGEYMKQKMFKGYFDDYFISNEMGSKKPNKQFFEKVIQRLQQKYQNLKPEDVIFFDDTQSHVESAKNIGIEAYLYHSPEQVTRILKTAKLL